MKLRRGEEKGERGRRRGERIEKYKEKKDTLGSANGSTTNHSSCVGAFRLFRKGAKNKIK